MTRKERTILAINHEETDFVPYQIDLTERCRERLLEHVGDSEYLDHIGNHLSYGVYDGFRREIAPDRCRDDFGVIWRQDGGDVSRVDNKVLVEPNAGAFHIDELDVPELRRCFEQAWQSHDDRCHVAEVGWGIFERAWTLRGMEDLLVDMIAQPEFVHELFDRICEHQMRVIDVALEYPFDIIYFGDDWGQQKGLIMGRKHWREFVKPRIARLFEKVKRSERYVALHSCGDIGELFYELMDMGLDIYQTFQPEIYDIAQVKQEYGSYLTFWGGISTQSVLPFGTPDEVRRVAIETITSMGQGGGYIAGPTHAVPEDVPPENLIALVDAFQRQD